MVNVKFEWTATSRAALIITSPITPSSMGIVIFNAPLTCNLWRGTWNHKYLGD